MRRALRLIALVGPLLLVTGAARTSAAAESLSPRQIELIRQVKQLQQQRLFGDALARHRVLGTRASWDDATRRDANSVAAGGPAPLRAATQPLSFATNRLVSDPNLDDPNRADAQSEPSIAAWGNDVLAAWNDGRGTAALPNPTLTGLMAYAYSTDGGQSFIDAGSPPVLTLGGTWTSDPVVGVNEKTGDFYFCAAFDPPNGGGPDEHGVAVAHATFSGGSIVWSTPVVVRSLLESDGLVDKPWMAVDSLSGNVYVTYTRFTTTRDSIVFTRSTDQGAHWGPQATLSSPAAAGFVQGSRPAVGPNGEVYVTWYEIGSTASGQDHMRIHRSNDFGVSFGAEQTASSFFANFGTGAPGYNREQGIELPSIAVDRSTGPNRGRVYVAWNESVNYYDSIPDTFSAAILNEPEPSGSTIGTDDTPATAVAFTPGTAIRGSFNLQTDVSGQYSDFDYYKWNATQGTTYLFWANELPTRYTLRIIGTDGVTRLAFSGDRFNSPPSQGFIVWTCPKTGTYFMRMAIFGTTPGFYRVDTGIDAPGGPGQRAGDHRDVFVTSSPDGSSWSTPTLVHAGQAEWFDDWLPEVAVAGQGAVYTMWYDWSDSPPEVCGGQSQVYLARSDDGGATWSSLGAVTEAPTAWTFVNSNIIPNQGDYLSLFANATTVIPCWTDGRLGTPDIFAAPFPVDVSTATLASLVSAEVTDGKVVLTWDLGTSRGTAEVQRRAVGEDWVTLVIEPIDGRGLFTYQDASVLPGARYRYRIGLRSGASLSYAGETEVAVPGEASVSLAGAIPNPATNGLTIAFALSDRTPATLELLDLAGRLILGRAVGILGPGTHQVRLAEGRSLPAGIYFVRLVQRGRALISRVAIVS